jgi:tight adherence protein C
MSAIDIYLPASLTAESMMAGLVGLVTFISVMLAWRALIEHRPQAARLRAAARRRREMQATMINGEPRPGRRLAANGIGRMVRRRLHLLRNVQTDKIRDRLSHAGYRSRESISIYAAAKLTCPILLAFVAILTVNVLAAKEIPLFYRPVAPILAALLGFFGPDVFLINAASKRRQALQLALPDGLDLLVICAEAGLSLDSALSRVAEEIGIGSPELADELSVTSIELNFLPERRMALENLARRVALPAIRGVINTLIQTEKYGTPLSQALRVLSAEFRDQRMLKAEEKAARLPATLTVPMILFILPTLFIVLVGPAMIDVYDQITK